MGMRLPRGRSKVGQIIIPALFLFPTFMLLVYLIYETARLSRDKIRHQFAIDAAVFVEMTNYSDFLNRTAYVNGAFPMRIFNEGFHDTMISCDMKAGCDGKDHSLWEIMCKDGDFPVKSGACVASSAAAGGKGMPVSVPSSAAGGAGGGGGGQEYTQELKWDIEFDQQNWDQKNGGGSAPDLGSGMFNILTMNDANGYWLNYDDATQVFKLYTQIYQLLGSVEDAQYSVLTRLASGHNFLQKSYWLNSGDSVAEAAVAAQTFDHGVGTWSLGGSSGLQYECYPLINYYGNQPTGSAFQPWQVYCPNGSLDKGCPGVPMQSSYCNGLFHLMWINPNLIRGLWAGMPDGDLHQSHGVSVGQPWRASPNYFNVDFNSMQFNTPTRGPVVHVAVAIAGFNGAKAAVWPDPTPKFQVRTYP